MFKRTHSQSLSSRDKNGAGDHAFSREEAIGMYRRECIQEPESWNMMAGVSGEGEGDIKIWLEG